LQRGDEPGGALVKFGGVVVGEVIEDAAADGSELQQDAAAVSGVVDAGEQASLFAALGELDDAVMAKAEADGGVGDGGGDAVGGSGDLQQELMLLGWEIALGGGCLAELQEGAELVAELGENLEAALVFVRRHRYIVSRCILRRQEFGRWRFMCLREK
jgi:hypothetical protein